MRGDEDIGGDGIGASELQLGIVLMRSGGLELGAQWLASSTQSQASEQRRYCIRRTVPSSDVYTARIAINSYECKSTPFNIRTFLFVSHYVFVCLSLEDA
jgi:hypothetical protein